MSEWRQKMQECAKIIPDVWGNQPLTNTIKEALLGGADEIERLENDLSACRAVSVAMQKDRLGLNPDG